MSSKKLLVVIIAIVFATSCRNNSTDKTETTGTTGTLLSSTTSVQRSIPVTQTFPVPDHLKTSFQEKYRDVQDVRWSRYEAVDNIDWDLSGWPRMDSSDYMVKFNMDRIPYWEWYDDNNNWIGTVSVVPDVNGLPPAVSNAVKSEFPGYTTIAVSKENDKNTTAYEIQLKKGDDKMKALISESGSVMKKKGVVAGDKMKEKNM